MEEKSEALKKGDLNEPAISYSSVKPGQKQLKISSLNQQEEEMYLYWVNLTPEQRLQHVYRLHKGIYGSAVVSTNKKIGSRIYFDAI